MTFIYLVAPKGAVFVFDQAKRLQGRSTIRMLSVLQSIVFRAGSQQLCGNNEVIILALPAILLLGAE